MPAAARGPAAERRLVLIGLGILALVLAGPHIHKGVGDLAFNAVGLAHGLLVVLAVVTAERAGTRRALWIILGVAVALRLALVFLPPHLSSDMFRYVWDGRVQGEGINPYRHIPAAPELAHLRDAAIFPFINRADYAVTIYPPAAEVLFLLVTRVADGMVAMKLAMVALEAVTVAVLLDLLRRIGRPAVRIVAYAWHPLAVWEIAGSAHIDAAMLALTMLGLWLAAVLRRPVLAAATIAVGALMKPLAALALPFAWKPWDWRAPAAAIGVLVALYIPYLSVGGGMFSFFSTYLKEEHIEGGEGFWFVWLAVQALGPQPWLKPLYLALVAVLLGVLALRVSFGPEDAEARLRNLSWLVFAGLFALSPNWPWYYLMLVPFAALFGTPAFWAATVASTLLYDEVWGDPHVNFWVRDLVLNLAVLAALVASLRARHRRPAAIPLPAPPSSAEEPVR